MSNLPVRFTPDEIKEFEGEFRSFDDNGDGTISPEELMTVLRNLGEDHDPATVRRLIEEVDENNNGTIEFNEFLAVIASMRSGKQGSVANFARIYEKQREMIQVKGHSGLHSYSEEEMAAFAEHINYTLGGDPELSYLLPIDPDGIELAQKIGDGVLLAKFINCCVVDTIDERALNKRKGDKPLSLFKVNENLNMVVSAAKSIGVQVINIGSEELSRGEDYPHIVLGLIWQLVKLNLLNAINLKNNPLLIRLLRDGETLEDLMKLPADQLLLRWINFHLENSGSNKRVRNFGPDLKDSEAYTILLDQITHGDTGLSALNNPDTTARAAKVIDDASAMGVPAIVRPPDIVSGNSKLNLAFCASIFNTNPGLEELKEEEKLELAGLLDDDIEGTREERAFRMWINTLGVPGLYINSLFDDVQDGLVLLKVIDAIEPGIVDWRFRVELKANNKFKKLTNNNYAVDLGKSMGFSLVGIGGVDIHDGNKKLILAFVWQLMRYHTIKFLSELSVDGAQVTEPQIVEWANKTVAQSGSNRTMRNFKDKSLATSLFLFDLLAAVESRIIDWDLVTPGDNDDDKLLNAKYAISIARKLNCTIFLLPEDIVEVKPKMMLTFVAAIMTEALKGVSLG